jgi:hypothetical protein
MLFTHTSKNSISFEVEKFIRVGNMYAPSLFGFGVCLKPVGGFWGTLPSGSEWDLMGKRKYRFQFRLKPEARVLHVYKVEDLVKAIRRKPFWVRLPDWEWLPHKWDAVVVHNVDDYLGYVGWDIPSIVVLNPEAIR